MSGRFGAAADSTTTVDSTIGSAHRELLNREAIGEKLSSGGLVLIENLGQFDRRVRFQVKTQRGTLWLTDDGIVFDFVRVKPGSQTKSQVAAPVGRENKLPDMERLVFKQKLVGSSAAPKLETGKELPGYYNYFMGSDASKWRTHVKGYSEVVYREVWAGIDLKLYANGANLEEEFIVHPGGDPRAVRVAYEGIDELKKQQDGSLQIATAFGELIETEPRIYEQHLGKRTAVEGQFELSGNSYRFEVARKNEKAELVIDPTFLLSATTKTKGNEPGAILYSSYLGGSKADVAFDIAVDSTGAVFLTGQTLSSDFPDTPESYHGPRPANDWAVFLSKVSALGDKLLFSTILGPGGAWGVAVDGQGIPYMMGPTRTDGTPGSEFPTTSSAYSDCGGHGYPVSSDFVAKLSASGDQLLYSTCIGSANIGSPGRNIAVDGFGKAYIIGTTQYVPTTPNAYRSEIPPGGGGTFFSVIDTNASGSASLFYSTYFGRFNPNDSFDHDQGLAIAVDSYGKAYLTGLTFGNGYPTTPGAFQTTYYSTYYCHGGGQLTDECWNAFVAKFDPAAKTGADSLIYSTLLGGSNQAIGWGIAVDQLGNAYVTGHANFYGNGSIPFPTTTGAYQADGLARNAFLTKLNAAGNLLVYSTMLGDPLYQYAQGQSVAVDQSGNAYVAGTTGAPNFPVTPDAYQKQQRGEGDAFLTKFNATGSDLIYSSLLGGTRRDAPYGVAIDAVGDAYVAGITQSLDFPITSFAFDPIPGGGAELNLCEGGPNCDGFVTKFPIGTPEALSVTGVTPNVGGNAGQVTPEIVGTGFHNGAVAKLDCGGKGVIGTNVTITAAGRIISATFDLTSSAPGMCDVVITNPDNTSATLAHSFTVQQGGQAIITNIKSGTSAQKPPHNHPEWGTHASFDIILANKGNIDMLGSILVEYLDPNFQLTSVNPSAVGDSNNIPTDNNILWFIDRLPAGETNRRLSYSVVVNDQAEVGTMLHGGTVCHYQNPLNSSTCLYANFYRQCTEDPKDVYTWCGAAMTECQKNPISVVCLNNESACVTAAIKCKTWETVNDACPGAPKRCRDLKGLSLLEKPLNQLPDDGTCSCLPEPLLAGPLDPNYLLGPEGVGIERWILNATTLAYTIGFSNEKDAGTAQQVVVTQPLGPNVLANSVGSFSAVIPNGPSAPINVFVPKGSFNPAVGINNYATNVDLRPTQNLFVLLTMSYDSQAQKMTWTFTSIDPVTGLPPSDLNIGFLPPGATGSVFFTVEPKQGLSTGTQITDQAAVVFDRNDPVPTPAWTNTIDVTAPTSSVSKLPNAEVCPSFTVQWSGSDVGAGIQDYTVYVSDNGGAFAPWQTNTSSTSALFTGEVGHTYGFYSITRDLVGNVEPGKNGADTSTRVSKNLCGPIPVINNNQKK